jgi:hypothetical protein
VIIQYVAFYVLFLPLAMFKGSFVLCIHQYFFLFYGQKIFHCIDIPYFNLYILGSFYFLAIMSYVALNARI